MCPDRELLSAYADGEVPNPWKDRIAEHLAGCASCAQAVAGYASLGRRIREEPCPDEAAILARGRARLEQSLERARGSVPNTRRFAPARLPPAWGLSWGRSVTLPLPLAAAAGLAFLIAAAFALSGLLMPAPGSRPALAAAEIESGEMQQVSMDNILRYLDSQNAQVTVTINLPSEATFSESGKPVIVRAPKSGAAGSYKGEAVPIPPAQGGAP